MYRKEGSAGMLADCLSTICSIAKRNNSNSRAAAFVLVEFMFGGCINPNFVFLDSVFTKKAGI
jgi:hypothetical protein